MSSFPIPALPTLLLSSLLALSGISCDSSQGPQIDTLESRVIAVGSEITLELRASGGADLSFSYDTNATIAENRGGLRQRPGAGAVFTWTPSGQDIGTWTFDFHAKDRFGTSTESITIDVRSAIGQDTIPVFRRPLGAGTALDLGGDNCVTLDIEIEDQDSNAISLSQGEPLIEGANLRQLDDLSGIWKWCPSEDQIKAQDRYMLHIYADDGENPPSLKRYQILLRDRAAEENCLGDAPVVSHQSISKKDAGDIFIDAQISDDKGIFGSVNLFYSEEKPSDPPDLSKMTMLPMSLSSGNVKNGTWSVQLPNPLSARRSQQATTLHYVVVADDNDDRGGKCDHSTVEVFEMQVVPSEESAGAAICEPCGSDNQCGGNDDLCLNVGSGGDSYCFTSCESDSDCPSDYLCSPEALRSVNGEVARQCIPLDESCVDLACEDDVMEQNDGMTQALPLPLGSTSGLKLCPEKLWAADEDWFEIVLDEDSQIKIELEGSEDPNMDLRLLDESGKLLAVSEDFGSEDEIQRCLPAGRYFVRAYSYLFYQVWVGDELRDMGNPYTIRYQKEASSCETSTSLCQDDVFEDDDNQEQARIPDFGGLSDQDWYASNNQICAGDQDWYGITAYNNLNHISVRVDFEQGKSDEDLDILLYDASGTLLTPCTGDDSSGCTDNGQSSDSGEYFTFQPPEHCSLPIDCEDCQPCEYFVVVNGFDGSENSYDICIGYNSEDRCIAP